MQESAATTCMLGEGFENLRCIFCVFGIGPRSFRNYFAATNSQMCRVVFGACFYSTHEIAKSFSFLTFYLAGWFCNCWGWNGIIGFVPTWGWGVIQALMRCGNFELCCFPEAKKNLVANSILFVDGGFHTAPGGSSLVGREGKRERE
jgi:hypothetical protein